MFNIHLFSGDIELNLGLSNFTVFTSFILHS